MRFYKFPIINHIDDVLPHIAGVESIKVFDRNGYKVIDYPYVEPNTFPSFGGDVSDLTVMMRRECRGLIFDNTGKIVSRRFHKFFNINERSETQVAEIDLNAPHHILEKLDGSCIGPFIDYEDNIQWLSSIHQGRAHSQRVVWGTMMGDTDVAEQCKQFVEESNFAYEAFVREVIAMGFTPIFEFCSLVNRVVIRYDQTKLVLLTVRNTVTGEYLTRDDVVSWAEKFNIPVVESYGRLQGNLTDFIEYIRKLDDSEGIVCSFDNGHMFKGKSEWYSHIHKTKEGLVHEKDIWKLILEDASDDIMPFLVDKERVLLTEFRMDFHNAIQRVCDQVIDFVTNNHIGNRKEFAEKVMGSDLPKAMHGLVFKEATNPGSVKEQVRSYALKATSSLTSIEEARKIITVKSWKERF